MVTMMHNKKYHIFIGPYSFSSENMVLPHITHVAIKHSFILLLHEHITTVKYICIHVRQ